jgi:hypothetical protein
MGNSVLGKSRNETQQVSVTTSVNYLDLTRPVALQTIMQLCCDDHHTEVCFIAQF